MQSTQICVAAIHPDSELSAVHNGGAARALMIGAAITQREGEVRAARLQAAPILSVTEGIVES